MIVLDTNVLSEPFKPRPNPKVLAWLDAQAAETLFISTISYAELRTGVLRTPEGARRKTLAVGIRQVLDLFRQRTLSFDTEAAEHLSAIAAHCERIGKRAVAPDAYIAAIARAHGFSVATRNLNHFEHSGVAVINPWE
jgi:predicted nucleic acid-binding protein